MLRSRMLAALWLLLPPPSLLAQQKPQAPVFPSAVELVTVDAVVLDPKGQPVRGLVKEDFALSEDGKVQEVASFEAYDLGRARQQDEPAWPSRVATNVRTARAGARGFVILVDDLGLGQQNVPPLVEALAVFFETAFGDGDEVTFATTSGTSWWSARLPGGRADLTALLGKVQGGKPGDSSPDFMSEWEAYRIDAFEGISESPVGITTAGEEATLAVVPPGTDLTGRVVERWIGTHACAPEGARACAQMVRMRAMEKNSLRRDRTRAVIGGVERAVFSLTGVRGRKELLLLSEGFLYDQELPTVRAVAGICRDANVVVNFLDVRGLVASIDEGTAAFGGRPPNPRELGLRQVERMSFEIEGSVALAEDTGGLAITNTNDLAGAARRVVDESRAYYLLGYYPPPGKGPRDWRSVKVQVGRPGLRVRARKGYTLPRPATSETSVPATSGKHQKSRNAAPPDSLSPIPDVSRALLNAHDADAIPLRAMAYVFDERKPGTARVLVAVEADLHGLPFAPGGSKARATLALTHASVHRDSGATSRSDQRIEVSLDAERTPGWSRFTREFDLPPGVAQVRVVLREEKSGRLGAVTTRFEVPPTGGLRLSTPILTDEVSKEDGRLQPVLQARRTFRAAGFLYCQLQVFGAGSDPQGGGPKVAASYVLLDHSGTVLRRGAPSLIAAAPGGSVVRLVGLPLEGLASGEYELVFRVEDKLSARILESTESFRLENSPAS
jgi:VWFA-related protein